MAKKKYKADWYIIDVIRGGTPAEVEAVLDYLESCGEIVSEDFDDGLCDGRELEYLRHEV